MSENKLGSIKKTPIWLPGRKPNQEPNLIDEPRFDFDFFSAEQRELHGKKLARTHKIKFENYSRDRLLSRLDENERILLNAHHLLLEDIETGRAIPSAGEWLLDNFYVIEEQIRMARRHLPKKYSRELPILTNTPSHGLPRVYDLALAAISYGDGRVDAEQLGDLVMAYQSESELQIGELWAIPIMLRLTLIENIRRVTSVVMAKRDERILAGKWIDRIIKNASDNPKNMILIVAD
ncbi:MAG: hypothetical protein ACRC2T_11455, partial [Thermoguttaceae bacterium]